MKISRIVMLCILSCVSVSCGYNTMQQNEEAVSKAWSDVESSLQRRADLIPNLVEVVRGYAIQEKDTLQAVIEARARAAAANMAASDLADAETMQQLKVSQGTLDSALSRLMVTVERYPDLKSNQNFLDLQYQLEGTENRINVARIRYNEAVENYNASIRTFPNSIINQLLLHLEPKEYFAAEEGAIQTPEIKFSD